MSEMGEVGAPWAEKARDLQGLGEVKVGRVRFQAQGVKNQRVEPLQLRHRSLGNVVRVGDIGEAAKAEGEHRRAPMPDRHRDDRLSIQFEWAVNGPQFEGGYAAAHEL